MKLLVLGATGRTGGEIVAQALEQGHQVTALVRDRRRLTRSDGDRFHVIEGAATDPVAVDGAVAGCDAVLCALGPRSATALLRCDLMQATMRALLPAMERRGVNRLVLLSALGAGAPAAPLPLRLAFRTVFRQIGRDKSEAEDMLLASPVDWIAVYPPALTDGPRTGHYAHGDALALKGVPKISRADVAEFMLAQAVTPTYHSRPAVIGPTPASAHAAATGVSPGRDG